VRIYQVLRRERGESNPRIQLGKLTDVKTGLFRLAASSQLDGQKSYPRSDRWTRLVTVVNGSSSHVVVTRTAASVAHHADDSLSLADSGRDDRTLLRFPMGPILALPSDHAARVGGQRTCQGCRPPVAWDHLDVSCASGMGPPERQ
jgi:hypothetical protein